MDTMIETALVKALGDLTALGLFTLAFVIFTRYRDSADARNKSMMHDTLQLLGVNIKESTAALTAMKDCGDETRDIVTGFRREVQTTHGSQIESLKAIQDVTSLLPNMAAAMNRIEPGLVDIRAAVEQARDIAAKTALALDGVLNRLDALRAHPVTPAAGVLTSAEKVRVMHEAAAVNAAVDARKTGEVSAVAASERTTDEQRSE